MHAVLFKPTTVSFPLITHLWSMLQWTGLWVRCMKTWPTLCIVIHFLVFFFMQIVSSMRYGFHSHRTLPQEYHAEQLRALWKMIEENGEKVFQALWQDLHKVGEVLPVLSIFHSPLWSRMVSSDSTVVLQILWDYSNCAVSCGRQTFIVLQVTNAPKAWEQG